MLAHCLILTAGAIAMWDSRGAFTPDWRLLSPAVAVAISIHDPNWMFLAINAALDLPIIAAFGLFDHHRRLACRLFIASLIARLAFMTSTVAAALYLESLGRLQVQSTPTGLGGTWRVYHANELMDQTLGHVLLGAPLVIYALRWTPMLLWRRWRRLRRLREGRCLACGYDLRAASGGACPECGTSPVTSHA
jgi:hypothetical protein